MSETTEAQDELDLMQMTSEIVSAYVSNNSIGLAELPSLIQTVHRTLGATAAPPAAAPEETPKATAAQIRKSITPDALISFEDGRSYKALKRHLTTRGMTIAGYKAKWGLPADYPVTAASYSAQRSQMAKSVGLGRKAAAEEPRPKTKKAK